MKRCTTCDRTYTDESLLFCADDGTPLVSEAAPAEPFNASPSSQPTIAFSPTPPASSYQPTPKKRKWLALIALALGLFALPFLLYSLSRPLLWEFAFRNGSLDRLFLSSWGVATVFGILLGLLSLVVGVVALGIAFKRPAQYGGRLLAVVGPVLSILLMVLVIGAFAFRRMQGPTFDDIASNSNYNSNDNSNYNWNRSGNDNSVSNSNSDSSSSNSTNESAASSDMSETDKYRLFYAAAKSGDTSLQQRAAKKVGIVDSGGMPTATYESFTKGMINWAFTDSAWVQTMDTPAKARAYAEERLD
jgi:hypothetical protein